MAHTVIGRSLFSIPGSPTCRGIFEKILNPKLLLMSSWVRVGGDDDDTEYHQYPSTGYQLSVR